MNLDCPNTWSERRSSPPKGRLRLYRWIVLVCLAQVPAYGQSSGSGQAPPKPPAPWQVAGVLKALADPVPDVQHLALLKIAQLKPRDEEVVKQVTAKLRGNDRRIRLDAIRALGEIGGDKIRIAVPDLKKLLDATDEDVREAAAHALRTAGAEAELIKSLTDNNPLARAAAAREIGFSGEETVKLALPRLIKLLGDDDASVRMEAEETIKNRGERSPL